MILSELPMALRIVGDMLTTLIELKAKPFLYTLYFQYFEPRWIRM